MATPTGRTLCVRCGKKKCTLKCTGCSKDFFLNHMNDHRQELTQQLDEIEANHNIFQESLAEQTKKLKDNSLLQQIDTWERDSIKKIKETAEATKLLLSPHINGHCNQIEIKLNALTNQLSEIHEENDFNEINLRQLQDGLIQLSTEPINLPVITIRQDSWSCGAHAKSSETLENSSLILYVEVDLNF